MIEIYTVEQVAGMLGCSTKTVEDLARRGELAGIKPGGAWVFPGGALVARLDELAAQEAAERRKPGRVLASSAVVEVRPRRAAPRPRPVLVDLRGG